MVKIARLEVENVKRVQAVHVEPSPSGLTILGGRNRQGKTSVLDAIVWALGGNKYKPSDPKREDSMADPRIEIELDNGLVVRREGKNSTLKVLDPTGQKAGQALLDALVGQLALDLPKFLQADSRQKGEILLQIIGVGPQLEKLDSEIEKLYNERHAVGQVLLRKKKHAEDLPFEQGAPEQEVSASELIKRQQAILAHNGENQRLRGERDQLKHEAVRTNVAVDDLRLKLREAETKLADVQARFAIACETAKSLEDESTAELEASLEQIDETNRKVRINRQKRQAEEEAFLLEEQFNELTGRLEETRKSRTDLLAAAQLPLSGLSVEGGSLTYQGQQWDCMSSADQLQVAVAIVRELRPSCQFVLLDKLEQMDLDTLRAFGKWLESQGLQAIATRVSTGGECSLIIEDGLVAGAPSPEPEVAPVPHFDRGDGF